MQVSLIIPVYNESKSVDDLLASIKEQTYQPAEVIIVDGGSTDDTVAKIKRWAAFLKSVRLIEAGRAMPGEGRNIGSSQAKYEWISYTDAGIKLDSTWLEELVKQSALSPSATIVYGNYHPQINSLFEKCSTIAYVPALTPGNIRGKSIVSYLFKKDIWEKVGGFPGWRAAEDLYFIRKAEEFGETIEAPSANARWQLQGNLKSVYNKFTLYSKHNVWAGRQNEWHYGILRQYIIIFLLILGGFFIHWFFFLAIPLWFTARTAKRIIAHRYEFGINALFNPALFFMVMLIGFVIDAATFAGWWRAIFHKKT